MRSISKTAGFLLLALTMTGAGQFAPVHAREPAAQTAPQAAQLPWLYENSDVPVDKSWTFGTLSNGLRYAVKRNAVPARQVSIRIRIDAGSLYEREDELGYAHLIEHLSFRGSTHVPDGESKRIWQRFGVTFGNDSNALTSPTQTVYKLDLPDAEAKRLGESMKILAGMMRSPNISKGAVAAESQIVQAELRENDGPQRALGDATRTLFFQGQLMATRSPIGSVESLRSASVDKLRAFHKRWYRPENTVISIAGDADPAELEALIRKYFGSWKVSGPQMPQPDFGKPTATGPKADILVDPTLPTVISMAIARPWAKVDDTIAYNEQLMIDAVAIQIVNRRLESRARFGGAFLQAQVSQEDVSRSLDGTFVTIMPRGNEWQKALEEVRAVIADAVQTPPSAADVEREVSEFANAFRIGLDSYPFEAAARQADSIVNAVDIRETIATPEVALNVFNSMRGKFTPERILASTRTQFDGVATRVLLTSPIAVEGGPQAVAAVLSAPVRADGGARLAEGTLGIEALPDLGPPGRVSGRLPIPEFDMEMIELSNGMRALLYPNESESGKIKVLVRFGRGYQAFSPEKDDPLAWTGSLGLMQAGVGNLDQEDLDRLSNGRRLGFGFEIDDDAFEFSADTRPSDLAVQLKLFAAKLAHPRWEDAPVERMKAVMESGYGTYSMSASSMLQRDMEYLLRGRDPRWKKPAPAELEKITPAAFRRLWEPLLASGPVEIMLFGDFKTDEAVKILEETFGALPPREPAPLASGAKQIAFPAAQAEPLVLTHRGQGDQAAAVIAWPTGGGGDVRISRQLEILKEIFQDRLFESFRSEDAASYSPYVISAWPEDFPAGGYFAAVSQVQPGKVDLFLDKARAIAADLAARPVSKDELERAVTPIQALIMRASSGNAFWMISLEGATRNGQKFAQLASTLSDYKSITPESLQALARQYLVNDKAWAMKVLPEKPTVAAR